MRTLLCITAVSLWLITFVKAYPVAFTSDPICIAPPNKSMFSQTFQSLFRVKKLPKILQPIPPKFTGFRFHKSYSFNHRFFKARKTLKVSYCRDGILQFQIEHGLGDEIDWNMPFCIYNKAPTVGNTIKEEAILNLNEVNCFKLARRKKYAKRTFDIFLPDTWVGGIFHCNVTSDVKAKLVENMNDHLDLKQPIPEKGSLNVSGVCTRENSIPLQPLMSSDYQQYWTNYRSQSKIPLVSQIYKMQVEKIIPFFETPINIQNQGRIDWGAPLEDQFSSIFDFWRNSSKRPWYEELEVRELYTYGEDEKLAISRLKEKTKSILKPFLSFHRSLKSYMALNTNKPGFSRKALYRLQKSASQWKRNTWDRFGISDKILTMLGPEAYEATREIKELWDNLTVVRETFEYGQPQIAEQQSKYTVGCQVTDPFEENE
ncbi:HER111Wp [Eremothecium sinecaudum]|uniref:HER111Wp n=1 Tax=Eremothecium sinecaudum TaxID=45286 RepID=A0A109UZG3_9SACH|nr:HER111Wp [Eremothecium sinecaudum]AMD21390.1 HER111Wp [Eremothecium sinecaudum]